MLKSLNFIPAKNSDLKVLQEKSKKAEKSTISVDLLVTLRACTRGKVISRVVVVVVVVVHKKIARSWDLGTSATRKYNKSVQVGEKLALGCLESSGMVYKLHK